MANLIGETTVHFVSKPADPCMSLSEPLLVEMHTLLSGSASGTGAYRTAVAIIQAERVYDEEVDRDLLVLSIHSDSEPALRLKVELKDAQRLATFIKDKAITEGGQ